jgi:hypothetical protein
MTKKDWELHYTDNAGDIWTYSTPFYTETVNGITRAFHLQCPYFEGTTGGMIAYTENDKIVNTFTVEDIIFSFTDWNFKKDYPFKTAMWQKAIARIKEQKNAR